MSPDSDRPQEAGAPRAADDMVAGAQPTGDPSGGVAGAARPSDRASRVPDLSSRVPDLSNRVADFQARVPEFQAELQARMAGLSAKVPNLPIRRTRRSDPAAGPALPEALTRFRRPRASKEVIARTFEADLSAPVVAAGARITNVRQITERVAMGRALWRELVVGFASQLGELNLGFTQLAALYVLAEGSTTTIADLAEAIGRSPSATSRLVDGLVRRRLVERRREEEDGRLRTVWLTPRGHAILRMVDRARAEQFLSAVRPLPRSERALIAMGVAALATHAISRRGRLVRSGTGLDAPEPAQPQKRQTTS